MTAGTSDRELKPVQPDGPSMDRWILSVLSEQQEHTLDTLGQRRLPAVDSTQFFLAIDRLSRTGEIALWPLQHGNYRVTRKSVP